MQIAAIVTIVVKRRGHSVSLPQFPLCFRLQRLAKIHRCDETFTYLQHGDYDTHRLRMNKTNRIGPYHNRKSSP